MKSRNFYILGLTHAEHAKLDGSHILEKMVRTTSPMLTVKKKMLTHLRGLKLKRPTLSNQIFRLKNLHTKNPVIPLSTLISIHKGQMQLCHTRS
jgi:hypothetical protein